MWHRRRGSARVAGRSRAGPPTSAGQTSFPSSRVIEVLNAGTSFGLTGVTVTGGSADDSSPQPAQGGGIYTSGAGLTLTDDAIVGNRVFSNQGLEAAAGGGLFIGGVLTMRRT